MNKDIHRLIKKSFEKIPILKASTLDQFSIRPLSGLTNLTFHVKNDLNDWVLRIPKQTNQNINRSAENHNTVIAHTLGLAPECIWSNEEGLSLTKTIQESRCLTQDDLFKPSRLKQLVNALQHLHKSSSTFKGTVDLRQLLTRYFSLMPQTQQDLFSQHFQNALSLADKLSMLQQCLVPSHNDLILENILYSQNKIWLIDWEYSSMNSPYWDLATLCNQGDMSTAEAENLLSLYQQDSHYLRIDILCDFRAVLSALTTFWIAAYSQN